MAKTNPKLNAVVRTVTGKKVRGLRKQGLIPSSVYGQEMTPISIQIVDKEMEAVFAHVGESGLVELILDGKNLPIIFRNPQYHPLMGNLIHVDCYKVNLKEKINAMVPIEFVGESPIVKEGKVLVEVSNEVEVEALPADLPEKIEVDLSKLETIESVITMADLIIDRGKVEIVNAPDQVVVKVEEPKIEEEPVVETVAPEDVPATEQKTPEELEALEKEKSKEKEKDKE